MTKKQVTLEIMENDIKRGDNSSYIETSSKNYLRAIAIGIKYLVENSK